MEVHFKKDNPPAAAVFVCELLKTKQIPIKIVWGSESKVKLDDGSIKVYETQNDILRILARQADSANIGGSTSLEWIVCDHWLSFSSVVHSDLSDLLQYFDKVLGSLTYLVANRLTIADLAVFSTLYVSKPYAELSKKASLKNVSRWMKLINSQAPVVAGIKTLSENVKVQPSSKGKNDEKSNRTKKEATPETGGRLQEGKFVDLPGAEMGKVIVRFPPEASGYLHIGHAKAALLNQYYQQAFKGKLIMRFDDTNPAKENVHFEKVILEDVEMLDIKPDIFTHTSQYFDLMLDMCERLIKEGKAFVDDTLPEQMKTEREQKVDSANRNNSVDKNLKLWTEMKNGSDIGIKCCVRAKIDMQSLNGCMRDPTIYRCKPEPHPRTGTQYKVYPTYDFACPIVDAVENVTHVLRTMEYHDRDPQFYWFIEALGLRKPYIWEYSRLSMTNTVLSKRKLTWFVENGHVDGWDDPRFPTVRGVLRRGMTVEGLKQFIIAQGSSRSVVFMEWDKIWAFNKKVIDPIAPRYTALDCTPAPVTVNIKNIDKYEAVKIPCHPKNPEVGEKIVWTGPKILIDQADAKTLKEGENTTFINWGNIKIEKIHRSSDGTVTSIDANTNLDDKDFKKTLKITWLAEAPSAPFTPTYCVFFDHIISKGVLGKDEDFKQYIGHNTRTEMSMLGDPSLASLKKGDIIQLQRKGFFKVDVGYKPATEITGRAQPCILFHIPDGHTKENPTLQKTAVADSASSKPIASVPSTTAPSNGVDTILIEITRQGDKIRQLKQDKADKKAIEPEVKLLLNLKEDYKKLTGVAWTPDAKPTAQASAPALTSSPASTAQGGVNEILGNIAKQGDTIRKLKQEKADKKTIEPEVQKLLSLKAEYKKVSGIDWTPDTKPAAQASAPVPASAPASTAQGSVNEILDNIVKQGDTIRKLKQEKADKKAIEPEVQKLLAFKADYKKVSGVDWTPDTKPIAKVETVPAVSNDENSILEKIAAQGDKIRQLKQDKADKKTLEPEVKTLLALKSEYKKATGKDWTPDTKPTSATPAPITATIAANNMDAILIKITEQGDKIRKLKSEKSDKKTIDTEVQALLSLKAEYKNLSGKDWTVNTKPSVEEKPKESAKSPPKQTTEDGASNELTNKITEQGNKVRDLKSNKASKDAVDAAVKTLLELKAEYKKVTGTDFPAAGKPTKPAAAKAPKKEKTPPGNAAVDSKKKEAPAKDKLAAPAKGQTRLGLEAQKETDLPDWYSQVITKGEMIEYYDVSGCYILRPWSYSIWDSIREFLSAEIKKLGVKDCYFPIFVSKAALEREKTHIADFAPEVAWVTKSGESDLAEPIAVRPTSETVMYPAYAKWIQSYRDLPLRLNQWNNVVRWEFQHPQPFLRSREFLWQEGHTAFASKEAADVEVLQILDLYARVYTDLLALPVVKGRKTEKEKFAGGDYTTTVEAFVAASGRGIQGATSHHLGQNFAKMFEIIFEDPDTQEKKYVFQNSWGLTTRTIGVMIMVHGDNQGLVLPPRVASVQAVVVPCGITASTTPADRKALLDSCSKLENDLDAANVRVQGDYRDNYSPGWKFNHWELKGVPIRIELGPKDMAKGQLVAVRRDSGAKITINRSTAINDIVQLLDTIHKDMLNKATVERDAHMIRVESWEQFNTVLDGKNIILAPYCGNEPCEDAIKKDSARTEVEGEAADGKTPAMGAKALCIPFDQPKVPLPAKCIHPACSSKPQFFTLFGRSY
ncbi:glutamyl-prolyl-tRNA synthetase [Arctopsyche grandis]|uniref:glutamyl-prolyl-tRNA synthetase n=1 Tax=Arctopsyche grandis TaxID=121162 RepID=UPI00406D726C